MPISRISFLLPGTHADDDPFFAPVAGALLGLQLFLRFDAVVAIGAAIAAVALGYVAGHRLRWTFFAPLAAAGALCLWYLTGPMREYFELPAQWPGPEQPFRDF